MIRSSRIPAFRARIADPPAVAVAARPAGRHWRPAIAGACLGTCAAALGTAGFAQTGAGVDELDVEPPLIEHEALPEAEAASRQSFVAQVVDERELESVRLHWRYAGESTYADVPMVRVSRSSTWLAQVTTDPVEARDMEYWIEARDAGGNRTVRGYAFSPLARRIVTPRGDAGSGPGGARDARRPPGDGTGTGPVGIADAPVGTDASDGSRRTLWVVLGALGVALAVGLASSGGGGGSGNPPPSGGGGCAPEGCRIVLTFDPPVAP